MTPFDSITIQFHSALTGWQGVGLEIAKQLFFVLAIIQLIWSAALWMFNKNDVDSILVDFTKKMIFLSIFWAILLNYDAWIPSILNSFREAGLKISKTDTVAPGDIFDKGLTLSSVIYNGARGDGVLDYIAGSITTAFAAIVIFLVFTRIAIEMILILIGSQIIMIGGIIMLGFAGSQWTKKYAERYFSTAIHIGVKMLFITLIVGLGESLSNSWRAILESAPSSANSLLDTYFSIVGASLVYGYLAVRIPDMAAMMLTGEPFSLNFSDAPGRLARMIIGHSSKSNSTAHSGSDSHSGSPPPHSPLPPREPTPYPHPQHKPEGDSTP